jgi:hypothetical protein
MYFLWCLHANLEYRNKGSASRHTNERRSFVTDSRYVVPSWERWNVVTNVTSVGQRKKSESPTGFEPMSSELSLCSLFEQRFCWPIFRALLVVFSCRVSRIGKSEGNYKLLTFSINVQNKFPTIWTLVQAIKHWQKQQLIKPGLISTKHLQKTSIFDNCSFD